jgi:hypothetical protein
MVNKQLEGNIKDLNSKMQRMEDAKEVVSNANILTLIDPSPSERETGCAAEGDSLP